MVLLLTLAATSIIGTVIPQSGTTAFYMQAYGPFLYGVFNVLDLFDMYHSWWFRLLLLMMTANIVVCSVDRLSATWKIIFVKNPIFTRSRFSKLSDREAFSVDGNPADVKTLFYNRIQKKFGFSRMDDTETGFCIFAEKWRWTRLGVYAVHLSVILLLIGSLVGSIFGFEGFVNIPEGESTRTVRLRNSNQVIQLPFTVRCDAFSVSFYESGQPKEFRSDLTILNDDKPVLTKSIIVNDPLRYEGINLFQSSYGQLPPREVVLKFESRETGMQYRKTVSIGQSVDLPEGKGTFTLKDYRNAVDFKGHNLGAAFLGAVAADDTTSERIILPTRFPSFDRMRKGTFFISIDGGEARYYTGLQVTKDPGVWVVYAGFLMMIIGCFVTFFMSHQRVCVDVMRQEGVCRVMVSGISNKNKLGMQNQIKAIARNLEEAASSGKAETSS